MPSEPQSQSQSQPPNNSLLHQNSFSIRNLTSLTLELQLIEQYNPISASAIELEHSSQHKQGFARHVTGWVARATGYGGSSSSNSITTNTTTTADLTPESTSGLFATALGDPKFATATTTTRTTTISSRPTSSAASVAPHAPKHVTSSLSNAVSSSQALLAATAQSYKRQQVSVRLKPFTLRNIDIRSREKKIDELSAPELIPDENLRLTIAVLNDDDDDCKECHRIEISRTGGTDGVSNRLINEDHIVSRDFKPLCQNAHHRFMGVIVVDRQCLAIFSVANLQCWMRELTDATPLSALSIPGTHNTPTYHRALPSVRCQAVSPRKQLENGIRFFDVRVQPESATDTSNEVLHLVHSVFSVSLTGKKYFKDLVDETADFLQENPSETVIMSVKREGAGDATDEHLSKILREHYTPQRNGKLWYTLPEIPPLSQVRGKIVLLRRFRIDDSMWEEENEGTGWGLEAECWANNTIHDLHGVVCVQDFYEVLASKNIDEKISFVIDHLACSASAVTPIPENVTMSTLYSKTPQPLPFPPPPLYLNFLSASNFWKAACWPEKISERLNPAIIKYLCTAHCQEGQPGDGSTGILVCDFVGKEGNWDIVKCIIGMNSKLELREKQIARSLRTD